MYLKFFIDLVVDEISKKWGSLYRKFCEEFKKETAYIPSGSAANATYKTQWKFYNSMQFLVPHVKHRDMVTSIDYSTNKEDEENKKEVTKESQTFKKTRKDNMNPRKQQGGDGPESDALSINDNSVLCKISALIDNEIEKSKEEKIIEKYMPLLEKGFESISEQNRFDCTVDIINYVEEFNRENS